MFERKHLWQGQLDTASQSKKEKASDTVKSNHSGYQARREKGKVRIRFESKSMAKCKLVAYFSSFRGLVSKVTIYLQKGFFKSGYIQVVLRCESIKA